MLAQQQHQHPIVADLVLIGGGHAHVHVLKQLGMRRPPGLRVTLLTNTVHTPYSGMLPGYVAGHYSYDDIHLDLQQICRWAGIRLVHAAAERITYNHPESSAVGGGFVYCQDGRPPIRFDCLSIDVGSAPAQGDQIPHVVPVKPIANFARYYQQLIQNHAATTSPSYNKNDDPAGTKTIAVVGGGAGGFELLLSLQYKLRHHNNIQFVLVTQSAQLLPQHNSRVRRIFERVVRERNIVVHIHTRVQNVVLDEATQRKCLVVQRQSHSSTDNSTMPPPTPLPDAIWCDDCLWCVSAGAPAWLAEQTPFATTSEGFVRVHDTWECLHHPGVCKYTMAPLFMSCAVALELCTCDCGGYSHQFQFLCFALPLSFGWTVAAGDCCHMDRHPRPKAGVFAVRAGPPLWVWKWKDWIDRTWMAQYQQLPDLEKMMAKMPTNSRKMRRRNEQGKRLARTKGSDVLEAFDAHPMRCGGCGAKVGSTTVSRVLRAVHDRQRSRALRMGLKPPPPLDHDDAAVELLSCVANTGGTPALVQTIDYFREMVADPFVFGKIVAVHTISDIHAMGETAQTALSLAVAPFAADESITESTLLHLLSGVSDVLQDEGVRMVGGHTCEGLELACGLSIQGFTNMPERLLRKRGGKVGDKIVLTKPIGTGALFAADMRAQCKGEHVIEAIDSMIKSNETARQAAMKFDGGARSCTYVTGFGLVGHLLEMLMANEDGDKALDSIGAVLSIQDIPFLRGGLQASRIHLFSTLQLQNARNRLAVSNHSEAAHVYPIEYPLLFDPQTAGGLMFFVDPKRCDAFTKHLRDDGIPATVIGELEAYPTQHAADLKTPRISVGSYTEPAICTIGSGSAVIGQRIRIAL
eukprot:scaffold1007_cov176-Amphora_coffeaeformis.AAC.21